MGPEDEVWIIGAFAMGRIRDTVGVVMLLPGRKFLVPGNYDRWSSAYPHRQDRVG
jgi:calcineurin-like phosphoesterase family protein